MIVLTASKASIRLVRLCRNIIENILDRACEDGIEIPIFVLGHYSNGVANGLYYFVGCNIANDKRHRFVVDAATLYRVVVYAEEKKIPILALIHNHVCGAPSPSHYDIEGMASWPVIWVIYSCSGSAEAWIPLTEKNRVYGIRKITLEWIDDCGSMVYSCDDIG